ncbi:unnamed protein product [Rangifer tarandus platyrhynchus]|uniref:Basic proline-rich protein-like n=2 Tax=Rangifer tarandus platyrhynchus TaxID=3082113 RepID=A0ABN8ZH73_RANTA|nr:unnamed protein product [Rangifer tarandus platyrhynchus]
MREGCRYGRAAEAGRPGLALHQIWARRGGAAAWPSCGARRRRLRRRGTKWPVQGPGREYQGKTFWGQVIASAVATASPSLRFFDLISSRAPLPGLPTPGPGALPALPWSSPGSRESTQPGLVPGWRARPRKGPGSARAPGRDDPDQIAPHSVLEWKPPGLSLNPSRHPFPRWAYSSRRFCARTREKATGGAASAPRTGRNRGSRPVRAREVPPPSLTCREIRAVPSATAAAGARSCPPASPARLRTPPAWLPPARPRESPLPRPRPSRARSRPLPPAPPLPALLPLPLPSCPPFIPQVSLRSLPRTWRAGEVSREPASGRGAASPEPPAEGRRAPPDSPLLSGPRLPPGASRTCTPRWPPFLLPPPGPARSSPAGPSARGALEANAG